MFHVFRYPNGDTGKVFATDLLRKIADLEIDVGINVLGQQGNLRNTECPML
jgi:hypothetical protein